MHTHDGVITERKQLMRQYKVPRSILENRTICSGVSVAGQPSPTLPVSRTRSRQGEAEVLQT